MTSPARSSECAWSFVFASVTAINVVNMRPSAFALRKGNIMPDEPTVTWYRWDDMPREKVSDLLDRRLITGDRMMLAQVYLKKGCVVPKHSHENEQLTYIVEGALRFWIGDDGAQELVVAAG